MVAEMTEERRIELAKAAKGLDELDARHRDACTKANEAAEVEKERHKAAVEKIREEKRLNVGPLAAKLHRARAAVSEIIAQYVPRELVGAEGGARHAIAKLTRTLKTRRHEVESAKRIIAGKSKVGDELLQSMATAEKALAEDIAALKEAQDVWEAARFALDVAIEAALSVKAKA